MPPRPQPYRPLPRRFFNRNPIEVARDLLGKLLVRKSGQRILIGRIVETESYLADGDPACHATRGKTPKNASMFGPPGHAYVYPIHARYCFNIVTEAPRVPSAVLVRAIKPVKGIDWMRRQRGNVADRDIGNGPAKLCQAMEIDRQLDGQNMTTGNMLWAAADEHSVAEDEIGCSTRIGVTSAPELELRFYVRESPWVSGPKRMRL